MTVDPGLEFAAEIRAVEGGTRRLERGVRSGALVRIRRGAYAESGSWAGATEEERHRQRALAFLRAARGAVVFCGETAAVLLGIPVLGSLPDRPVIAVTPRTTCTDAGAIRRAIALEWDEVVRVGGVLVTGPLRTAIDLAAGLGPDAGAVALSDVVRRWGVTRSEIEEHVAHRRPFRGVRTVEVVLPSVSALSETPIEALAMLRFLQLGFMLPNQQVQRRILGRSYRDDFEWPSAGVIGEADGRLKYTDHETLWAEKVREDDLRSVCRSFVRIYWSDLQDRPVLREKLRQAGVPRASDVTP